MTAANSVDLPVIGLLGGSFDPIHVGHLQVASHAIRELGLQEVRFIPAGLAWQKTGVSAAQTRLTLLQLALMDYPHYRIDTRELDRSGPTYTIDTLESLRHELGWGCSLVWLMGFDQLLRLRSWHRWTELLTMAHIAYTRRPGFDLSPDPELSAWLGTHTGHVSELKKKPAGMVLPFDMPLIDCSATQIRLAFRQRQAQSVRSLLPDRVFDHLETHSLYLS